MSKAPPLILRVCDAQPRDVGRAIARIDPKDMRELSAGVGDVIEIKGTRHTVSRVMPAYMDDRDKQIIQIDEIIRENAMVGVGESVEVRKVSAIPAEKITLSPLTLTSALQRDRDSRYIGRLIEGFPLISGDRVRVNLFGTRFQDFRVVNTAPSGEAVIIKPDTSIRIEVEEPPAGKEVRVSYQEIGGLHKEIRRVREMIELPLKYPQIFRRLGIEAPKGVLLYGPPGTGKTLIARAVANETEAHFIHMNGPEVMHKFYGESEARLRRVFEEASKHAPSIIFLDEIDAIASKRAEVTGEVEKRVVAQLLALMDGLESRGQVIVIGASNIPDSIDPALRRPGRFDREIAIGIPDRFGRLEILQIHTKGMPLAPDVDLEKLSEITHGFVGADLAALCREAAMAAVRRILPKVDFEKDEVPYEAILGLYVTMGDFTEAMKEVEPSAIREFFVEVPDVRWEDVGGLAEIKKHLKEAVEWPLKYPNLFKEAKIKPLKGILLYGTPGTGKTLLAKALANESGVNFISIKGPALISKYVGESEKAVREVFKKAKQASPCILFFDEIDSLTPIRGISGTDSHVIERVISQFLSELDGIEELKDVVVLAATNRFDMIDPALLRTGRFDLLLELPIPDGRVRLEIFKIHTRGKPLSEELDFEALVDMTEGCVGADIEAICQRAAMIAIREYVGGEDQTQFKIRPEHFFKAAKEVSRSKKVEV